MAQVALKDLCVCSGTPSAKKVGEFKYFTRNIRANKRIALKLQILFEPREAFLTEHLAVEHFLKKMLFGLDVSYQRINAGANCPGINFDKKYFTHEIKLIISDLSRNISDLPMSEANNLTAALSLPSYLPLSSPRPIGWAQIRYFDPDDKLYNRKLSNHRKLIQKEFAAFQDAVFRRMPKCCW